MDNDDATIGTIYTRRQALAATAKLGAVGLLLSAARSAFAEPMTRPRLPLIASPAMTEGPFFVDEKLNRSNLLGDTTRQAVVAGVPLLMTIAVYKLLDDAYEPMKDVQVDVWHCDALGVYSGQDHPMNLEPTGGEDWLRGYQVTGEDGLAKFRTIVPGWYPGRTPHVHFKVRPKPAEREAQKEFTSQLFFNAAELKPIYEQGIYARNGQPNMSNARDGIYQQRLDDSSPAGDQLLLDLEPNEDGEGYYTELPILLTDESLHSGRGQRGFGGRGPRRGGPPPLR